jgi:hypothetical protein
VNHRKNKYKTGEYEVEIKWKDYDMESNTWDMREKMLEVPDNFSECYNAVSVHFKRDLKLTFNSTLNYERYFIWQKKQQRLYQRKCKTMKAATSTTRS